MNIYVGNLSYSTTSDELEQLFSEHGQVDSAAVIMDRDTGRSRGFGFVTFAEAEMANAAMSKLDGTSLDGRSIVVNEARERGAGGGGGGGGYRERY